MSVADDTPAPVAFSARRRLGVAAVAFVLALAYLLPFRAYGLNVEDEGTLLYQILRVTRGELPYVDFSTGYTPGFFALNALAWHATGDLVSFRTLLAFVHAGTVAGMAALLAGVARPLVALLLPALYLAYIPLFPGEFCAFNVAYPAWFATAGWLATVAAVLAFTTGGRRRWLVAAGVAAAVTLAMKPNAGVFAFAAAAASVLASERRGRDGGRLATALWSVVGIGIVLGVVVVFGGTPRPLDAAIYLVPLVLVTTALVTPARTRRAEAFGDLVVLTLPFVALSAPWLVFFWRRLGTEGFLREVLLIGSHAADIYYVPFPAPEPWALLLSVLIVAYGCAALFARRWLMPRAAFAAIVAAVVASFVAVSRLGVMPEGLAWSIIWQLQSTGFMLTLVTHLTGIAWLWRRRLRPAPTPAAPGAVAAEAAPTVLLVFAIFMDFQLYPRADFMHLLIAAPLSLVFAGFLLERVLVLWDHALAGHRGLTFRGVEIGTALVLTAAVVVGLLPGAQALSAGRHFVLPFAVAPVGVEAGRADDLRALAAAGERLQTEVAPGDPSVGFPSIGVLLFLTGGRNPTPHDYFYPGRPDHREEAEIVDTLAATRPASLAALNRHFTFFDASQAYYFLLRRWVRAHYALGARAGRFDVLERRAAPGVPAPSVPAMDASRRDASAARPAADAPVRPLDAALARVDAAPDLGARLAAVAALEAYPAAATAPRLLALASAADVLVRRAALAALLTAVARAPEHGLEHYVAASSLDRRRRILVLRTIRDLRDPRAASHLFAEAASGDPRLVRDALGAMQVTRAEMIARRHLWAGPERPAAWPGRTDLLAAVRATLAAATAPNDAAAFAAHLAGMLDDRAASVALLRGRLAAGTPGVPQTTPLADAATTASAADALVALAPDGLACDLVQLLARPDAPIQELVPSRLLDLAATGENARREVVACLRDAIAAGSVNAAPAVWIAAALGEGSLLPVVRAALRAAAPDLRQAAAWTLGELPDDAAAASLLADAAEHDPDEIVRRLARSAYSKQMGRRPRTLPLSGSGCHGLEDWLSRNDPVSAEGPA